MNEELKSYLLRYEKSQIFVLCDSHVTCDMPYPTLTIEVSETNKSIATVETVWNWLSEHNATRKALLINVGGGCLCDIGGLAAATYLRGIDYLNIPTTLLAMVDAAIGGKTGVNFNGLKNYIGAFRLPVAVIIEPAYLDTLPPEQLLSGYGEVLKTALLIGDDTLNLFLQNTDQSRDHHRTSTGLTNDSQYAYWQTLIEACKHYKESIVAQDPQEKELRKVLNFGHTVGHAIEESLIVNRKSSNRPYLHGYCVAWGIVAELYLSVVLLSCPRELLTLISHFVIGHFGRPECNCHQQSELIDLMRKDKKNADAGHINFTLLRKAGDPIINQVADSSLIEEALDYLFSL